MSGSFRFDVVQDSGVARCGLRCLGGLALEFGVERQTQRRKMHALRVAGQLQVPRQRLTVALKRFAPGLSSGLTGLGDGLNAQVFTSTLGRGTQRVTPSTAESQINSHPQKNLISLPPQIASKLPPRHPSAHPLYKKPENKTPPQCCGSRLIQKIRTRYMVDFPNRHAVPKCVLDSRRHNAPAQIRRRAAQI